MLAAGGVLALMLVGFMLEGIFADDSSEEAGAAPTGGTTSGEGGDPEITDLGDFQIGRAHV